jgi:hypothetical protein
MENYQPLQRDGWRVVWQKDNNYSEEYPASIFRKKGYLRRENGAMNNQRERGCNIKNRGQTLAQILSENNFPPRPL